MNFSIDLTSRYGKQLYFIAISLFIAFLILIIDWKFFYSLTYPIYSVIVLLLMIVLINGVATNGARSWFELGSFKFQPAEFAKFATALALAKYYNTIHIRKISFFNKLKTFAIFITPLLLIIMQNDIGSALVFTAFMIVLYREGLSVNFLISGLLIILLFILTLIIKNFLTIYIISFFVLIFIIYIKRKKLSKKLLTVCIISSFFISSTDYIFKEILSNYQQKRINVLLGKEIDPQGASYNLIQSKIAIGSGGFTGKGFLNGTQTRFDFVPEQSTDFIFCTIGEEWGFIGVILFLSLYITLLLRILFLAERQRSNFSRIYGYSVATILFIHFTINIGMTIGLVPVIGIPLPFISYGGSSLLGFTILLFIFLNLDSYRLQILR
jgi:rod shape determining protein RodA